MELKWEEGAYRLSRQGGFETVSGREETLQRVLMRLSAWRGGFFPLPEYGSALHRLGRVKPSRRAAAARQMVYEALLDEPEAAVEDVTYEDMGGGCGRVTVVLRLDGGEDTRLSLTV